MTRTQKWIVFAGIACCVTAVLLAICGCIPYAWIRPLGRLIRRPDDVTLPRYYRYLQVCWFFAFGVAGYGIYLLRCRQPAAQFVDLTAKTLREVVSSSFAKRHKMDRTFWGLFAAGTAVRLAFLDQPMAYDESYSLINFAGRPIYLAIGDFNSINNHLLNTLLMHISFQFFGPQEWALRLPVFAFGLLVIPACWQWARCWLGREHAWLITAFISVSPMMITYSVDARGYMYITFCTVVLDHSLTRLRSGDATAKVFWAPAWLAVVIGFWSMFLMVYPIFGLFLPFFVLARSGRTPSEDRATGLTDAHSSFKPGGLQDKPPGAASNEGEHGIQLRSLAVFSWGAIVGAAVLYAPGYVFRGLAFLDNPTLHRLELGEYFAGFVGMWTHAFAWWTDGPIPRPIWLVLFVIGLTSLCRSRENRWRLLSPLIVTAMLTAVQRVTPPPRIFMFLTPFFYLIVAHGVVMVVGRLSRSEIAAGFLSAAIVAAGLTSAFTRSVLFFPEELTGYLSVPHAIERLGRERQKSRQPGKHRLIAPLPCDLPSLFYMDRFGFRIPVNGEPTADEMVWLIARPNETPSEVLESNLVGLGEMTDRFDRWQVVDRYETLTLYRSGLRRDYTAHGQD